MDETWSEKEENGNRNAINKSTRIKRTENKAREVDAISWKAIDML